MDFEGRLIKPDKSGLWLVEIPALDVMTQGKSRKDALRMIKDAVTELLREHYTGKLGRGFRLFVDEFEDNIIGIRASDSRFLFALALRRQREKNGSTVRDAAKRLNARSPNAYAQYEQGRVLPSMQRYEVLLMAANPTVSRPRLHFG